jgi:exosortase A
MSAVLTPGPSMAGWRGSLLLWALVVFTIGLLFRDSFEAMASIWARSDTFAHCYLVPPIAIWLVWRARDRLQHLAPQPWAWGLVPMLAVCGFWLVGQAAAVNAATQFAVVALVVLSVPTLLGLSLARVIAFPLLFLFFAVPFGDFLTMSMMGATADFTVSALQASGIPVYREGLSFVIPSGRWSVVEACSGIRYLIASFMVGTLFAYLNFTALRRRLVFVAVSIAVPIVANWLRAYMIVMLGHYSGNTIAVGVDHLIYGWLFFGIVILAMFVIGARFAETGAPNESAIPAQVHGPKREVWPLSLACLALVVGTQVLWRQSEAATLSPADTAETITLPGALSGGWQAEPLAADDWSPRYLGAASQASTVYRRGPDAVMVWMGHYRAQSRGRKMLTSTNSLVESESRDWLVLSHDAVPLVVEQDKVTARSALLRSPADPNQVARKTLLVNQFYWVGGAITANDIEASLRMALRRLLGRGDDGAVIFFSAQVPSGGNAQTVLSEFAAAHGQDILGGLNRMAPRSQAKPR